MYILPLFTYLLIKMCFGGHTHFSGGHTKKLKINPKRVPQILGGTLKISLISKPDMNVQGTFRNACAMLNECLEITFSEH